MLLFVFSILIGGCATTTPVKRNPTPEERESIRKVGLVVKAELAGADFNVFGGTGGALSGAAKGFVVGILNPMTWVIGGPFVTTPVGAVAGAGCKSELSSIENPEQLFQETIKRLELPSRLEKHVLDSLVSGAPPNKSFAEVVPSIGQETRISYANSRGLDTLLELRLYVSLSDASVKIEGKDRCGPRLATGVTATLQRVSDGTILAERSFWADSYKTLEKPFTFQKMLTEESAIVQIVDDHFIRIANMIIKWISPSQP